MPSRQVYLFKASTHHLVNPLLLHPAPPNAMNRRPISLVVIHGVGPATPGQDLRQVSEGLAHLGILCAERSDLVVEGRTFARLKATHPVVAEIVEVNWADIGAPKRTLAGTVLHFLSVIFAMLTLAEDSLKPRNRLVLVARALRWFFEAVLVWCPYPAIFLLFYELFDFPVARVTFVGVFLLSLCVLTRFLDRFSPRFRAGYLWAVLLLGMAVGYDAMEPTGWIQAATFLYCQVQIVATVLAWASIVEILVHTVGRVSKDYIVARIGFIWLPFVAMSGLGAVVWALALFGAQQIGSPESETLKKWGRTFLDSLTYDLLLMEVVFGGAVLLLGLFFLAGTVPFLLHISRENSSVSLGDAARNWIARVLLLAPLLLAGVLVTWVLVTFRVSNANNSLSVGTVIQIYTASSLRLVPFLAFFVGPLAVLSDIVGDVVFYLLPSGARGSIHQETRTRLRLALQAVRAMSPRNESSS
ncbi:MAG: hypothetical protein KDN22_17825 [Verrucomicrobiae bacterium]|nr:hypothetical protein [Verrucomicrobiae bacterium]